MNKTTKPIATNGLLSILSLGIENMTHPAKYEDGVTPKARYSDQRGKTRKGARHTHGEPFRSALLFGISPAEYRRRHLGKKK